MSDPRQILRAHTVYMSDADELATMADPDLIPHRTCLCGAKIVGFDEYITHLEDQFERNIE